MTDPERLDLASASEAYANEQCKGRRNLIRALREAGTLRPRISTPEAESGTVMHAAWSGTWSGILSPMQTETVAALRKLERLVAVDWAGRDEYTLLGREVRLWLHQGFEPVHSGKFDVAYGTLHTHRMLIMDGKTLYGEVQPALENAQLRELVGLARFNYPKCEEFTVAILQPNVAPHTTIAVYDQPEAELALRRLRMTIADSADPDAPRTPGAWCEHCPAISECEEARGEIGRTYNLAKRIEKGEYVLPIGERGSRFLDSVQIASKILDAMRERYRELIASDSSALPGWYLKDGNKVREITDVAAAYQIAAQYMSLEEFLGAAQLRIGPLEERIGKKRFNAVFEPVITFKQNAPTLSRRGQKPELDS